LSAVLPILDDSEYLNAFARKTIAARIPLDGSLELTHRCNLRCVHCYLGDQSSIRKHHKDELSTVEIKHLIDQFVAAGMLNLLISGGDPMVRKDFAEIYTYAIRSGVRVSVFCDGVLVTERIVELFNRYPPRTVEVSLYGATAQTYERITQVKGSFERCLTGIDRLLAAGHRVRLKTVLMTHNRHELEGMEAIASARGIGFYFDTAVFPCLPHSDNKGGANKDRSAGALPPVGRARTSIDVAPPKRDAPLQLRLSPVEAAKAHLANPEKRAEYIETYEQTRHHPHTDQLYTCGAAQTNFHVDPYGKLQACTISTNVDYSLREGSFKDGWNGPLAALRQLKASPDLHCNTCDKRSICSGCPAMFSAETGQGDEKVQYHCHTTHELFANLGLAQN
jgi:radical SAM protein with 4Fe4S-binding SPASM domain